MMSTGDPLAQNRRGFGFDGVPVELDEFEVVLTRQGTGGVDFAHGLIIGTLAANIEPASRFGRRLSRDDQDEALRVTFRRADRCRCYRSRALVPLLSTSPRRLPDAWSEANSGTGYRS
jgi:hypothetical protein